MAETMCAGPIHRSSEFALVGTPPVRLFGACGPDALATVLSNALGKTFTTADVYVKMAAFGFLEAVLPDRNAGMSTSEQWLAAAKLYAATVTAFRGYAEPWPDWPVFFDTHAGHSPMVVEVARNWLIRDELTGLGQNANTDPTSPQVSRYHIFAIFGRHTGGFSARAGRVLPAGYWVADGDNLAGGNDSAHAFQAADVLQFYSDATMAAAQPCAALAIQGQGSVTSMAVDVAANFKADPANAGWYSDTRTGERIYQGCLDALVKAGDDRPVLSGIKPLAGGSSTTSRIVVGSLATGTAVWIGDGPPVTWTVGFPGNALLHAESALDACNLAISRLQAQIAKQPPAPAPAPAPTPDPTVARNAAIGAAMLDVLSLAGVKVG